MKFVQQAERLHSKELAATVVPDSDLAEYFQELGSRVAIAAKSTAPGKVAPAFLAGVHCQLVNSNVINAFSTGGNYIYVTNGLFQQCQSEDELAAAIAHAYAHLINLDLESTKMEPDAGLPLPMVAWQYVNTRFSRERERRADALGLALYARAGWEPSHFALLFEHMEALTGGNVAPDREPLPARAFVMESAAGDAKGVRQLPVADPKTFLVLKRKAAGLHDPPVREMGLGQTFLRAFPNCVLSADTAEQHEAQERLRPVPVQKTAPEPN